MARPPKTTTAATGNIAPFGLRMLPELKERVEAAARESGRSMNAEIVARLESSLGANEHEIQSLKDQVRDLEHQIRLKDVNSAQTHMASLANQLTAARLAAIVPVELLSQQPDLMVAAQELVSRRNRIMVDMMEATLMGMTSAHSAMREGVKSGVIKVVPERERPPSRPPLGQSASKAAAGFEALLEHMDKSMLEEFLERPAVKAFLERADQVEEATPGPSASSEFADDAPAKQTSDK